MAHTVANRWLDEISKKEYRFSVFPGSGKTEMDVRLLAGSLRSWRDGNTKIASVPLASDLGVRESVNNSIEVWSSDCDTLRKLSSWMESKGFETNFIW
jgi:hypothetical protein